jgi:hypothetical protein
MFWKFFPQYVEDVRIILALHNLSEIILNYGFFNLGFIKSTKSLKLYIFLGGQSIAFLR